MTTKIVKNEKKPGYKKTELGWIPEEWEIKALGSISDINQSSLTEKTEYSYSFFYIDISSVNKGIINFPSQKINFYEAPSRARRILNKNDVIMSMVRPYLQGFALADFNVNNVICSTGFAIITPKTKEDTKFIYQSLYGQSIANQIAKLLVGSNYPAINASDVEKLLLPIPKDISERCRIAEILSCWDKAIEKTENLIELKTRLKKALMQQLLTGKRRFREFVKSEKFKKTELGLIPEDWDIVKLSDVVLDFIVPMRDKPKRFGGNIPWCRIEDFDGKYLYGSKSNRYINMKTVEEMNLRIYPVGTVLCSCSANVGVCAITANPLVTNQTFIGLVPSINMNNDYLYHYLYFNNKRLQRLSSGTTIAYLSRDKFEKLLIVYPSQKEQNRISFFIDLFDNEINILSKHLELLKQQKKGLMQKLLTGQVRVKI